MTSHGSKFDDILKSIYYSPSNPAGFASIDKLYFEAKKLKPDITRKDVISWSSRQITYTLHKPVRRNYVRNRIVVYGIDEQWEADLVEMQEFSRMNRGIRYILTVIDVFSKYAWAFPLKSKTGKDLVCVFTKLFNERTPACLRTDMGKEFVNFRLQQLLKDKNVRFYTSSNRDIKCAVIERFNRTLKSKMFKYFTSKGTRKYVDRLNDFMQSYNKSYHRSIKMTPNQVTADNSHQVLTNLYGNSVSVLSNAIKPKLESSDTVRMIHKHKPFDKGFYPNWTDTTYKIKNVDKSQTHPVYVLENESGETLKERKFYENEIQKITSNSYRVEKILRRRTYKGKAQYLIKWIGYSSNHNSWINSEDLTTLT